MNSQVEQRLRLRASDLALLFIPAALPAARVVAANPVGIPHLERLVLLAGGIWATSIFMSMYAISRVRDRRLVVYTVFIAILMLTAGGGLARDIGLIPAWLLSILAVMLTVVVVSRFGSSSVPQIAMVVVSVALAAGPILDGFESWRQFGVSQLPTSGAADISVTDKRDVLLVVLDGFPGLEILSRELDPALSSKFRSELDRRGFQVPSAISAYTGTNYSLPSILQMDYPVTASPASTRTLQDLYDIVSGANPVRSSLQQAGYTTHMVESGWSGSSCGTLYDECVTSSWYDDPMYFVTRQSLLSDVFLPGPGWAYAVGARLTMTWASDALPRLSRNGAPDFVFAHVMAPHPPLFLDEGCAIVEDPDRSGFFFQREGVSLADRDRFMREQLACVTDFVTEVVDSVSDEAVLVFMSDHGTDRRDQLKRDHAKWSDDEIAERMTAFVAARLPRGCAMDDRIYLPNVMRTALSCIAEEPLDPVPDQMFLFPLNPDQ